MNDVAKYPGLLRREAVFYFRKRIPTEVQRCISSDPMRWDDLAMNPGAPFYEWRSLMGQDGVVRREIVHSLGTKDRREAERLYLTFAVELERFYERIIARMQAEAPPIKHADLKALAAEYFALRQEAATDDYEALGADKATIVENWRDDLIAYFSSDPLSEAMFTARAEQFLRERGYACDENASFVLGGYIRRAERVLLEQLMFDHGELNEAPRSDALFSGQRVVQLRHNEMTAPHHNPRRTVSVRLAYASYVERKSNLERHSKTLNGYDYVWRLMEGCFDVDRPMSSLTRDDAIKFEVVIRKLPANWSKKPVLRNLTVQQAALEAESLGLKPIAPNTLYGYLSDLSAFFEWARAEDYVEKNLAKGLAIKPSKRKSQGRRTFTIPDLKLIFGTDYRGAARPYGGSQPTPNPDEMPTDARYWVPLLALFTGMRLSELCQLTRKEVDLSDGIPCIFTMWDVSDDNDYEAADEEKLVRSMKSEAAKRAIPLVDELLRLGFWEFVERIPVNSSKRLFPQLVPDKHGYIAAPVSRWFSRYKTSVGISDKAKVFHSLRHTFRSAMANAGVSHDVAVRVGGWSGRGLSDHYRRSDHLTKLTHEQLNRISYAGLDLSHLYRSKPPVP